MVDVVVRRVGGAALELVRGDITQQQVDAVVNAANPSLFQGVEQRSLFSKGKKNLGPAEIALPGPPGQGLPAQDTAGTQGNHGLVEDLKPGLVENFPELG